MVRIVSAAIAALLLTGAAEPPASPALPAPLPAPVPATPALSAPLTLTLVLTGLRSSDGELRLCLWQQADAFPDCKKGQDVRLLSAPAAPEVRIAVPDLAPGRYAVSVIHDENDNRKLDKNFMGIPTEGVGFSHNPAMTFGPPSFAKASFDVAAEPVQTIRMKYFL